VQQGFSLLTYGCAVLSCRKNLSPPRRSNRVTSNKRGTLARRTGWAERLDVTNGGAYPIDTASRSKKVLRDDTDETYSERQTTMPSPWGNDIQLAAWAGMGAARCCSTAPNAPTSGNALPRERDPHSIAHQPPATAGGRSSWRQEGGTMMLRSP
jgi:hypothetical protein